MSFAVCVDILFKIDQSGGSCFVFLSTCPTQILYSNVIGSMTLIQYTMTDYLINCQLLWAQGWK